MPIWAKMNLLRLSNIEVYYNEVIEAVRGVSLDVAEGRIVVILGGNGAGKSTILKAISRVLDDDQPEKGTIDFLGKRIDRLNPKEVVRLGILHVPEGRQVFGDLTVKENLLIGAFNEWKRQTRNTNLGRVYTYFPILQQRSSQRANTLSGGEQQILSIGRALMAKPKLLMLDEPSLGLAPIYVKEIFKIIETIHQDGTTVLLVEQNARKALSLAHYGYVLENGRIVLSGPGDMLAQNEDIKEFYLGMKSKSSVKGYQRYKRKKKWR
jgi:branched-chain amino acid transport system ATP-binding protein